MELRLKKLGVFTGEILDENQVGLPGLLVHAYREGAKLKLAGDGETDDRGVFRIAGLEPGRYYIRTDGKELEDKYGLLPTFFGQTTRAQDSRLMDIRLEEEYGGITIQPLPGKLSTISGNTTGIFGEMSTVTLFTDSGTREKKVPNGGPFRFEEVAPGTYELLAESLGTPPGAMSAYRKFTVDRDVDVKLDLAPSPDIRLRCEERHGTALDTRSIPIFLHRMEPPDGAAKQVWCNEPAVTLSPNAWEWAITPPAGMYVYALPDSKRSESGYRITPIARSQRTNTVIFSTGAAEIGGMVRATDGQPAMGAPVFLVPVDKDVRMWLNGVASAISDQNGMYSFAGVIPGRYEVVSSFQLQNSGDKEWTPGISGQGVTVEEGAKASLDIRLTEVPE